jgi:predicted GNAT family acetyltransferase
MVATHRSRMAMNITLTHYATADAFLNGTQQWLMCAEAENNLILGIAAGVANAPSHAKESPYFVTASSEHAVVGCAVRCPPYPLAIARCTDSMALELIVNDVLARYSDLQQVGGPEPTITRFGELWGVSNGRTSRRRRSMRIYEIRRRPASVHRPSGQMRAIAEADLDLVTSWLAAFVNELGVAEPRHPAEIARTRLAAGDLYVWDDDGPVSMVGFGGKTPNGVRVNFLYTPEATRRRGYATACVAALTQMLMDRGNRYCALYTDLANPTSNAIYQRIGYEHLCDAAEYELG